MRTVVLYKSILGATKKYAIWLAEETQADILGFGEVKRNTLDNYEVVVIASGTYAGHMPLTSFLIKYWYILSKKKVVAVAVGTIPVKDRKSRLSYELIPMEIRKKITYFKIPGKMLTQGPEGQPIRDKLKPIVKKINSFGKVK